MVPECEDRGGPLSRDPHYSASLFGLLSHARSGAQEQAGIAQVPPKEPRKLDSKRPGTLAGVLYLPARDQGTVSQTAQAARAPEAQDSLQRVLSPKDPRIDGSISRAYRLWS